MSEPVEALRIGEVARQTGLTVETLRYYERVGVLPPPQRSSGGFRFYGPDVVARLQFIKRAQSVGLSLEEIRGMTSDTPRGHGETCRSVYDTLTRHIADLDQRLSELHEMRKTLNNYRHRCEVALSTQADAPCPAIEALEQLPK